MAQDLTRYTYWLAVLLTPGVGARLAAELLKRLGAPEKVFSASRAELEACGLPTPVAGTIQSRSPLKAAEEELEKVRQLGCRLLAWDEPDYPPLLKEIYDSPMLLYVRGDAAVLSSHCLAIVGSRQPSPYGQQVTGRLAQDLAGRGLTIVSGLARGIDSTAHRGALDASGKTIAVLGCGIDVDYPKENKKLRAQIESNGCVITEFPIGIFPAPPPTASSNRERSWWRPGRTWWKSCPRRCGAKFWSGWPRPLNRRRGRKLFRWSRIFLQPSRRSSAS